ncbi:10126_t:CDS:2, partial [Racocetra fulgida]
SGKGSVSIQNQNFADSNKPKKKKQKTQLQQLLAEEKRKKNETKGSISASPAIADLALRFSKYALSNPLERIEKETKDKLNMDPSRSGRDAETVYRDKHAIVVYYAGKKIDIAAQRAEEHDKELNEEQKSKERWNDPAALFLTK